MQKLLLILLITFCFLALPDDSFAQLKRDSGGPNISGILSQQNNGYLFGLIDPAKMQMHHSMSMSYGGFSGNGMMLSSYMNTIDYQVSEKLFIRANLGIMTSPYNTMGENFYLNKPQFFGGAQMKYQFNENSSLMLKIDTAPFYNYYRTPYSGFYHNQFE